MRITLITILFPFTLCAQQEQLSAFFWNNYSHINPATSGLSWGHELNATYRNQWQNVNGAPVTIFGNYNTIVADRHGAGINYIYDKIGFTRTHKAFLNYNYQFSIEEDNKLALGVAAGAANLSTNGNWIPPTTGDDPYIPGNWRATDFLMNAGIAYKTRSILTGISVTQIHFNQPHKTSNGILIYSHSPHLHAHFRYYLRISRRANLIFETLGRTDFVKWTADLSARCQIREAWQIGLAYRYHDMFGANLSWSYKQRYHIGYAYEFTINKLNSISQGTHEIQLRYTVF